MTYTANNRYPHDDQKDGLKTDLDKNKKYQHEHENENDPQKKDLPKNDEEKQNHGLNNKLK